MHPAAPKQTLPVAQSVPGPGQFVATPQLSLTTPHLARQVVAVGSRVQHMLPLQTCPLVQHVPPQTVLLQHVAVLLAQVPVAQAPQVSAVP